MLDVNSLDCFCRFLRELNRIWPWGYGSANGGWMAERNGWVFADSHMDAWRAMEQQAFDVRCARIFHGELDGLLTEFFDEQEGIRMAGFFWE